MITMLYEKTLSRKIIGLHQKPAEEDPTVRDGSDTNDTALMASQSRGIFKRVNRFLKMSPGLKNKLFARTKPVEEAKLPASMGKILNLMR